MNKIEIECPTCEGTGLYAGMCEQDGCAVICDNCNGKGYTTYEYNDFTGKKVKEGVIRVFEKTCGYVHSGKNCVCDDGRVLHFENYGCSYEEWLNGKEPRPMEELVCPYQYYNNGIGNEPFERCRENAPGIGFISDCKLFAQKDKCWEEYNKKCK